MKVGMCTVRIDAAVAAVAIAGFTGGCSQPLRKLDDATLTKMAAEDDARFAAEYGEAVDRVMNRVSARLETGSDPVMDILAISGGGDWGAFGSGFLVGWKNAPGELKRPDFDVVTGVSTGALISPFAFVGSDEAFETVLNFYRNPKPDWVSTRGLFFFGPWNPSFATIPGLRRDLTGVIDQSFAEKMAAQSNEGKLLLVSASNLDRSRQRFWYMGPLAVEAARTGNLEEIHKRLLASSAIPVVFPPVEIDGFLYGDGGVTANVLLRLEPHAKHGFIQTWMRKYPGKRLPKVRYWIIINNQIQPPAGPVQQKWTTILSPALAMSIRSGTMAEVRWLAAEAMYVNAEFDADIEVRTVSIPNDWRPPVEGSFQRETMNSLADIGLRMGSDPASWMLWCEKRMSNTKAAEASVVPQGN